MTIIRQCFIYKTYNVKEKVTMQKRIGKTKKRTFVSQSKYHNFVHFLFSRPHFCITLL
jgi:hypothetical protein